MPVDCNECEYLDITEAEQNYIRKVLKKTFNHTCTKYNKRVLHNHNAFELQTKNHSSCIYPCGECLKETEDGN